MGLLTPVEQQTKEVFGMVPMEERLSILPRYSSTQGLIAPQFIYDLARAVSSPITAMRGQQVSPEETLNTALSTFGGSAVGVAPKGSLRSGFQRVGKGAKKTQFDIANEIAQKNATEMLGLPPNNTAMDRARALGFNMDVYHATTGDIKAFDPLRRGSKSDSGWYGDADYTTPNAQYAHRFIEKPVDGFVSGTIYEQNANILPLKARAKNSYDWRENEPGGIGLLANDRGQSLRKRKELESRGFDSVAVNNSRIILPEGQSLSAEQWKILTNASPMLKSIGKDKVESLLRNGYDFRDFASSYGIDAASAMPQQKQLVELATFNPNQLRSRFAAFDPARINEANLLAMGGSPLPLGLLIKDDKKQKKDMRK